MSERYPSSRNERLEKAEWMVHHELVRQTWEFPYGDPRLGAFALAAIYEFHGGDLKDHIHNIIDWRMKMHRNVDASTIVLLLQQGIQFDIMDPTGKSTYPYPEEAIEWEFWRDMLESVPIESDSFWYNTTCRDPKNNIPQRYKPEQIIMQLSRTENPTMIDVGTSLMQGPKLIYSENRDFKPFNVLKNQPRPGIGPELEKHLTSQYNSLLTNKIKDGLCVGIDLPSPIGNYDSTDFWARSNSFSPSELLDEDLVAEYDELLDEKPTNVLYHEADFKKLNADEIKSKYGVKAFDYVFFSHVLYQSNALQQRKMREKALELLGPKGKIIYELFMHVDPKDPNRLIREPVWRPWHERTVIEFASDPGYLHEVFLWSDRRCNNMIVLNQDVIDYLSDGEKGSAQILRKSKPDALDDENAA